MKRRFAIWSCDRARAVAHTFEREMERVDFQIRKCSSGESELKSEANDPYPWGGEQRKLCHQDTQPLGSECDGDSDSECQVASRFMRYGIKSVGKSQVMMTILASPIVGVSRDEPRDYGGLLDSQPEGGVS